MMRFRNWAGLILAIAAVALPGWTDVPEGRRVGKTIELFNGKNLDGWKGLGEPNRWLVASAVTLGEGNDSVFVVTTGEGIMVNSLEGRTVNIATEHQHGDCHLSIEFVVPKGSNSGVYLQGLYEIQVFDSYGKEKESFSDCGGIYARYNSQNDTTYEGHAPKVNASRAPGEWQSFEAVFRAPRFDSNGKKTENARFLWVKHNGVLVQENVEVTGGTRAHMNRDEAPTGPLMLQGDHGPVAYRNIRMTPLKLD